MVYSDLVRRKTIARAVIGTVVMLFLAGTGWAMGSIALQVPGDLQPWFLYAVGGFLLLSSFLGGLAVERIGVRSWDTWIGGLGPSEIEMLRELLANQAEVLATESTRKK